MRDVTEVVEALGKTGLRWGLCGGWGLEFFGKLGRPHEDIDVATFRDDFATWARRAKPRLSMSVDEIMATGAHEVHTFVDGVEVELLLNEMEGADWVYRRDRRIRLPLNEALLAGPVPVLAPEIILLFKSKSPRDKDVFDFDAIRPLLGEKRRAWLAHAIEVTDETHAWVPMLRP